MSKRTLERETFGKKFYEFSSIRHEIAKSACEIEQARLLTLSAADKMDKAGNKEAKDIIAMIKIVAPNMAQKVIDRAMQILGGKGGGGRKDFAQAGGQDQSKINDAFEKIKSLI